VVTLCVGDVTAAEKQASDMEFSARLIWGTDDEKPASAKIVQCDEQTLKKLKAVFRWKNYFEISRKQVTVPYQSKKRVRLSKKCEIEISSPEAQTIEVRLFGEGKLVISKRQKIRLGELLVLAGDDLNKTAWFVTLTQVEGSEPASPSEN